MTDEQKALFTPPVAAHCKALSAYCDALSMSNGMTAPQVALSLSTMLAAVIMEHYPVSEHENAKDAVGDMIAAELEQMVAFEAKEANKAEVPA